MDWRTRLFEFPGGVLEVRAYEGESAEDGPGVYLERFGGDAGEGGWVEWEAS